jgi:hypothetical protein
MAWKVPAQVSASLIGPAFGPSTCRQIRATRRAIFGGSAAGERHQQDAARIDAVDDKVRDTVRQRDGRARPGTGNDQQRGCRP